MVTTTLYRAWQHEKCRRRIQEAAREQQHQSLQRAHKRQVDDLQAELQHATAELAAAAALEGKMADKINASKEKQAVLQQEIEDL